MTTKTAPKGGLQESITLPHTEELELYNNSFSSCSQKVRLCLAEGGQSYKNNHIHLIETGWYQTCSPEYKKINPGATVPVLVHNGHPVYESHDQIHYVNDKFLQGKLCPPAIKDEVDDWTDCVSIKGDPMSAKSQEARIGSCIPVLTFPIFASMTQDIAVSNITWGLLHHPNKERPVIFLLMKTLGPYIVQLPKVRALIRIAVKNCRNHLQRIEKKLSDGREFICGRTYTLGDVGLTSSLLRIENADFQYLFADLPYISKYWARLKARPSFDNAITSKELPIMTMAFARVRQWKETYPWFKDALETDQPISSRALVGKFLTRSFVVCSLGYAASAICCSRL